MHDRTLVAVSEYLGFAFAILSLGLLALAVGIAIRRSKLSPLPVPKFLLAFQFCVVGLLCGVSQSYLAPALIALLALLFFVAAIKLAVMAARERDVLLRIALLGTALTPSLIPLALACEEFRPRSTWNERQDYPAIGVAGLGWLCLAAAAYLAALPSWMPHRPRLRGGILAAICLIPFGVVPAVTLGDEFMRARRQAAAVAQLRAELITSKQVCGRSLTPALGNADAVLSLSRGDRRLRAAYYVGQEVMTPSVPGLLAASPSCSGFCSSEWVTGRRYEKEGERRYAITASPKGGLDNDPWSRWRGDQAVVNAAKACEQATIHYLESYNSTILNAGAEIVPGS